MNKQIKFGILGMGIFIASIFIWLISSMLSEGFDVSRKPIAEYNNLFTEEVQTKLQNPYTFKSKIRQPESNYIIDSNYHLTVYKLILANDKPLKQIIDFNKTRPDRSSDIVSDYADDKLLKMTKASMKAGKISSVGFRFSGKLDTVSVTDSYMLYHLKFKAFSISYDNNEHNDIWAEAQTSDNAIVSLAFIKKQKALYIMLLFRPEKENIDFAPDFLYKMIKR